MTAATDLFATNIETFAVRHSPCNHHRLLLCIQGSPTANSAAEKTLGLLIPASLPCRTAQHQTQQRLGTTLTPTTPPIPTGILDQVHRNGQTSLTATKCSKQGQPCTKGFNDRQGGPILPLAHLQILRKILCVRLVDIVAQPVWEYYGMQREHSQPPPLDVTGARVGF